MGGIIAGNNLPCPYTRAWIVRTHEALACELASFLLRTSTNSRPFFAANFAAALNRAAELGAVKVDEAAYRKAALEAQKTTGELLPGVVIVPPSEHFSVSFGHARMTGKDSAGEPPSA